MIVGQAEKDLDIAYVHIDSLLDENAKLKKALKEIQYLNVSYVGSKYEFEIRAKEIAKKALV